MATSSFPHVYFFDMSADDDHAAVYRYKVRQPVDFGTQEAIIEEAVRTGQMPPGGCGPDHDPGRPERYLDIDEAAETGVCTFAFRLNGRVAGAERLKFLDPPFIPFPLSSTTPETYLDRLKIWDGETRLWASFTCDLAAAAHSPLAGRIRKNAKKHGHADGRGRGDEGGRGRDHGAHDGHGPAGPGGSGGGGTKRARLVLSIPFIFNVVDPELGAAPWVVPRHRHGPRIVTHGGVHPAEVAFLNVAFDE